MKPIEEAFLDVAHAVKKDPAWVIQDFIPVGLTFLAGPPKVAHKSTISMVIAALCARWQCHALPRWMSCTLGGPSMLFSYEADAGEVRSIIEDGLSIPIEPGCLYVASDPWMFQLDVPGSQSALIDYLESKKPRLVVMDPFRNMWSGDENDSGQIIKALGPMQRWLKANEAAGIVVHHVNKPMAESPNAAGNMFTMRGSSAIPGLADGIVVVEPTKHEGQVTIHTRFKRGPSWRRTIQLGVPGYGWPSQGYEVIPELAHSVKDHWENTPRNKNLDWLAEAASTHRQPVSSIRDQLQTLARNGLIVMSNQERSLFLPTL